MSFLYIYDCKLVRIIGSMEMFSGVCWFRAFRLSGQGLGIAVIKDIPAHGVL